MRKLGFLFVIILGLLVSGCSVNEDAAKLYKNESPLKAEINLPKTFSNTEKETIKVVLSQDGNNVEDADYVHLEIWKQDGSLHYHMEQAKEIGEGTYSLSKDFKSDGLYYIKVHASNNGSIIMPQKQFIVGDLSKEDLKYLQKGQSKKDAVHEHHH